MRVIAWLVVFSVFLGCTEDESGGHVIAPRDGEPDAAPPADGDVAPDVREPDPDVPPLPADALPPVDVGPPDAAPDAALPPDAAPPLPACANGVDDDGDGRVDYPADPGCADPADDDEVDPATPACSDGEDNDGDGRIDHPEDPGCFGPDDPSEASACGDHEVADISALARVEGTTAGRPALYDTCRVNQAPEAIFRFTLRQPVARLHFDTAGTGFDTLLGVWRACDDPAQAVACNDDVAPGTRTSAVDIDAPALGDYFVVVDGFLEFQGDFVLNVRAELPDGAPCADDGGPVRCRLGSACVEGSCAPAACSNGVDDDDDGRIDFPNEPGCESPEDDDETDPDPLPQCGDGLDNDADGLVDYPADPDCTSAADDDERRPPACSDGVDNDGDGLVDLADPGCRNDPLRNSEFNVEACRDAQDNDGDGRVDYPNDPGCLSPTDPDETNPDPLPACADGVDNDGDGLVDFPEDAESCQFAADPTEDDACERLAPVEITGLATARGNTDDAVNEFGASCRAQTGPEDVVRWRVAQDRALRGLVLSTRGSDFDTVLSVRTACAAGAEVACDDNGGPLGSSVVRLGPQPAGTDLLIFVDAGGAGAVGIWRLRVTAVLEEGANCAGGEPWICADGLACRAGRCAVARCANGQDDDGDGLIDFPLDPGCATASDDDEVDPAVPPQCANGLDDDGDGRIDYPADPDCAGAGDTFEGPACSDGIDNDGDGSLDYDRDGDGFRDRNADPGCACAQDHSEEIDPQCSDGCDNDGDGLVDLADPGCEGNPARNSEFNIAHCRDGRDNDGDGLTDFPWDPGCVNADDPLEDDPPVPPACADGLDNDGDGLRDYPEDSGCSSAADDDERGPCDVPQRPLPDDGTARGSTQNEVHEHVGSCNRGGTAPEAVFVARVPYPARVTADTVGSSFDTVIYARRACAPMACPEPLPDARGGGEIDAGMDDAAVDAAPADAAAEDAAVDVGFDAAPDAAMDAEPAEPDAAMPPACVPAPTELACNDDAVGLQSRVEIDWPGGDLYLFADGFGGATGNYQLNLRAVYPEGGRCGPELVGYATCAAGTACRPDEAAGFPTCQR